MTWTNLLRDDPLPWLLADDTPAVRAATLVQLLDRAGNDEEVVAARKEAMATDPIKSILEAQEGSGAWGRPGPGYTPKFTGTGWQLFILDQLGADPSDERIQKGCEYLLAQAPTATGGLGTAAGSGGKAPSPSSVFHCFNGALIRPLIAFGWLDDHRVQAAIDWCARAVTGEGMQRFYASGTSAPGFACGSNEGKPCAWGAIKELLGLARVPADRRSPLVSRAIDQGVEFLLAHDVLRADYPKPDRDTEPSSGWFKLGFPSGYVTDILQNLQVLAELGHVRDERLVPALEWLADRQDAQGRWRNEYALNRKTTVDIDRQGAPSKWVTLRACTVLRAAYA